MAPPRVCYWLCENCNYPRKRCGKAEDPNETLPLIISDKAERTSKTMLVFDGCFFANLEEGRLIKEAKDWWSENRENRRLITVSSMGPHPKSPKSLERRFNLHGAGSWSLEEYLMAIQNDEVTELIWMNVESW
jgi:hypothetical protein